MKTVNGFLLLVMGMLLVACGSSQGANPQPGATFSGDLTQESPGGNTSADGGMIEFTITGNGESIASLSYSLFGDSCWNESRSQTRQGVGSTMFRDPPPPINNGMFAWETDMVDVEAVFASSTEASGSIAISITDLMSQLTCDYGTWTWNAIVQ